jgi:glycosyltransferase involved in cell wall biosynthesis
MKITAVVITKNEEKNIKECIKTLEFFDEILVIDDESRDNTIAIINDFKDQRIKILEHQLNDNFAAQRNFGLENASNDYVFFVDADERITKALEEELSLLDDSFDGYLIKRSDLIWGKELKFGETGNMNLLRLGNRNKGRWSGKVHEQWLIKGKIRKLRSPIFHYPHQSISEFLKEINYYTDLRAKELKEKGVNSGFLSIVLYTKGKFFLDYFIKQGFRDGIEGFVMAIMMTFHSFLVRGKLWLLWQKE